MSYNFITNNTCINDVITASSSLHVPYSEKLDHDAKLKSLLLSHGTSTKFFQQFQAPHQKLPLIRSRWRNIDKIRPGLIISRGTYRNAISAHSHWPNRPQYQFNQCSYRERFWRYIVKAIHRTAYNTSAAISYLSSGLTKIDFTRKNCSLDYTAFLLLHGLNTSYETYESGGTAYSHYRLDLEDKEELCIITSRNNIKFFLDKQQNDIQTGLFNCYFSHYGLNSQSTTMLGTPYDIE